MKTYTTLSILTSLLFALLATPTEAAEMLLFYNGNNGPPTYTTTNGPNYTAPGIQNATPITDLDSTLTFPAPYPKWSATSFTDGNAFVFSFDVAPGFQADLTRFYFDEQGSPGGPTIWNLSVNGQQVSNGTVETMLNTNTFPLSITGLTGTVNFRLSATGGSSGTATYSVDGLQVDGLITAIPEPSMLLMGVIVSLALASRRRR